MKGLNKIYEFAQTYSSMQSAVEGLNAKEISGQLWTRGQMYETKQGDKICYTCKGYPRCPKRMQLTLDPESSDVHVHVSTDAHDHHLIATTKGLNPSSKAQVLELLSVGVTQPRKILKELEKNNLPPLTKPQLNNLKQFETQKKVGGPQICSLSDFLL